jgi:hypothetical protein
VSVPFATTPMVVFTDLSRTEYVPEWKSVLRQHTCGARLLIRALASLVLIELQSVGSSVPVPRFCQFSKPGLTNWGWARARTGARIAVKRFACLMRF